MTERRWVKVEAARSWRPHPGQELIGIYSGCMRKTGPYGEYSAHYIREDRPAESWVIYGARLDNLFMSVQPGARVRIVFNGREEFIGKEGEVFEAKDFDLFVEVTVAPSGGETVHEALATPLSTPW